MILPLYNASFSKSVTRKAYFSYGVYYCSWDPSFDSGLVLSSSVSFDFL